MEEGKKKYILEKLERMKGNLERIQEDLRTELIVKGLAKPKKKIK